MPKISVIIPAYNAERTILETIKSVQQQTFLDFELTVINDGSTDRTLDLLNTIAEPRLKVFSYTNGGLSVARNRGLENATGEFIAFLDADDLWKPDKLELQLSALQNNLAAGVAYSWTCFIDEDGNVLFPHEAVLFQGNVYSQLLLGNFLGSGSVPLIRRQAIESVGMFNPLLKSAEDWDYYLRLAARWHFVVVPKIQVLYRRSSGSLSSKIKPMTEYLLKVHEQAFRSAPPEFQYLKNQSLANIYQNLAHLCLTRVPGDDGVKQASQNLKKAVSLKPKLLLNRKIQRLAMKLVLMQLLSRKVASRLTKFIGNKFPEPTDKNL
ncbi:MAG: glycosyltransferase [Nostoc indistinguendum CM1-VF10]|jgi:glycosyltransferase involved in cell wall biosynthesis|nr:glycosyltransferase [Nostoc indistinguendum CM1-VF10]